MKDLYEIAEENSIDIFVGNIPLTKAFSVPGHIALDWRMVGTLVDERSNLGHEMGHCMTNSFYKKDDPIFIKRRCENKADKWMIQHFIKRGELEQAIKNGYTEIWQLADLFCVTEEVMYKAVWWYKNGNLALPHSA